MSRASSSAAPTDETDRERLRLRTKRRLRLMSARLARRIDRPFATLLPLQWLACVAVSVWILPHPYQDTAAEVAAAGANPQLVPAALVGGLLTLPPLVLILLRPGTPLTRHVIGAAQVGFSMLLIHLTGGRLETHFHIFLSLAFLAAYRDWQVLALPTALVLLDHYLMGRWFPESIYGTPDPGPWRWAEHAFWLLFTDAVLVIGCLRAGGEMRRIAAAVAREKAALRAAAGERDAAFAADRAKSAFLANMSHEIRTPLNAILGFTDLLRSGDCPPAERNEHLDTIRGSGDHLLALINDILDLSKVESGRMTFERAVCDPGAILADVLNGMRVAAEAKGLTLRCEWKGRAPETVVTDPARVRQILLNLVGNAVKFTAEGSVRVLGEVVPRPGGAGHLLAMDVYDTGEGIPAEKLNSIFDPFTQADASITRRHGGTGLGLSISRQIAQHLGGTLVAASRRGWGSLFRVTVDAGDLTGVRWHEPDRDRVAAAAQRSGADAPGAAAPSIRPDARVLLVDDGEVNRRLIRTVLGRAGLVPREAINGRAAVELAVAAHHGGRPFDVILMDMQMPVLDGYAAAAELRASGLSEPIVALTAHAMAGDRARCLEAGCTEYLSKPVRPADLLGLLGRLLPGEGPPPAPVRRDPVPPAPAPAPPVPEQDAGDDERPPGCDLPEEDRDLWPVAAEFAGSLPDRIEQCRALLASGDAPGLSDAAHKLAGTAGTLGYPQFTPPARALESSAESNWDEAALLAVGGGPVHPHRLAERRPGGAPTPRATRGAGTGA